MGRNLSSFHRPLAIDPQPPSLPSTPSCQSQPAVLPAALSPITSPERGNADRDPETTVESEESYHVSPMFVSPENEVNPEVNPEVTPEVNPELTPELTPEVNTEVTPEVTPEVNTQVMLRPFLATISVDSDIGASKGISQYKLIFMSKL